MLRELSIKNVAVIDTLTVPFVPGLNVLTGETGAGKSILIDALQLVLGARSSEDLLRSGAEEAVVEAAFDPPNDPAGLAGLEAEGIAVDPGEFLILRRHVFRDGKSKAYVGGRPIDLTYKEVELLRFLATNQDKVFTREALLNRVWGYDFYGGARTVDVHIRRLRSKIEDRTHSFIETVRNVGYRFHLP